MNLPLAGLPRPPGTNFVVLDMAARCFIRYVTDEGCCGKNGEEAKVNGVAQTSDTLGLRSLCTADGSRAASLMLPAGTPEQRAEVKMGGGSNHSGVGVTH